MTGYFENKARADLLNEALLSWHGTPFAQGQQRKGEGVDCVRFVSAVMEEVGLPVPVLDGVEYSLNEGRHTEHTRLMAWLHDDPAARAHLRVVEQPALGDILAVRQHSGPHHLGIASDSRTVWHCDQRLGVCLVSLKRFTHIHAYRILDNFQL